MEKELEEKINQQFCKIVKELDIGSHYHQERDWKIIGTGLSAGLLLPLAPLTVPLTLAYTVFFSKHYAETVGALAMAAGLAVGPIVLPLTAVSELVNPTPKEYLHLGNENIVVTENHSLLPAVYLDGIAKQFSGIEIYFSSGDVSDAYSGKVPDIGNHQRMVNRTKYDRATYFLNISSNVNKEMNQLLEERAKKRG